ncbi:MAG TPA: plastocyanin/azurin family copper-binding protein [Verrucomicrobiales bacterium]|nr:plastocyanin/azurin family copper-binding protein [Verrucomicrobiales bacterium]
MKLTPSLVIAFVLSLGFGGGWIWTGKSVAQAEPAAAEAPVDEAAPGEEPASEEEEEVDITIEITGNDLMQYNKKAFTVNTGQKVKLVLKNIGQLPKLAMGHNVVILQQGAKAEDVAVEAIKYPLKDYIPQDEATMKKILAYTKMLGPGETDAVIFTAPKPGNYIYFCSFPAHFATMRGTMTVKE